MCKIIFCLTTALSRTRKIPRASHAGRSRRRYASPRIAALTSSSALSRRAPRAGTRHLTRLRFSEPQGASTLRLLRCSRVSAAISHVQLSKTVNFFKQQCVYIMLIFYPGYTQNKIIHCRAFLGVHGINPQRR
jgi:hypothetical protein